MCPPRSPSGDLTASVLLLLTLGCQGGLLDPAQTVVLTPEDDWTPSQRQVATWAAESWNLEFGTHFEVRALDEANEPQQRRHLRFRRNVCVGERCGIVGRAGRWEDILLDPDFTADPFQLFTVTRHELGHVFGMAHVSDPAAVMAVSGASRPRFRSADADELQRRTGFRKTETSCRVTHDTGAHPEPQRWVPSSRTRPLLLTPRLGALELMEVDPRTGVPSPLEVTRLLSEDRDSIAFHLLADGLGVTWLYGDELRRATARGDSARLVEHAPSSLTPTSSTATRIGRSTVHLAPDYYVATNVRLADGRIASTLEKVDVGQGGSRVLGTVSDRHLRLFVVDARLLALAIDDAPISEQVSEALLFSSEPGPELILARVALALPTDPLRRESNQRRLPSVVVTSGGAWVGSQRDGGQRAGLVRLRVQPAALSVVDGPELPLARRVRDLDVVEQGQRVFLGAVLEHPEALIGELRVVELDPVSLEAISSWVDVSAIDVEEATHIDLTISEDHLVATWLDETSPGDPDGVRRLRCVPLSAFRQDDG